MLLMVDAGNTRIKWAVAHPSAGLGQWTQIGQVARDAEAQVLEALHSLVPSRILVSNVAGDAVRGRLEQIFLRVCAGSPTEVEWFVSTAGVAGLRNGYRRPEQLGCDRFAAAIGAHALFPGQALIVASCGTATTIDAVSADGLFIGGLILPGLDMMMRSLAANTAQLPLVATGLTSAPRPFADNTDDAIFSGCCAAQVGAIERAVALHPDQAGAVACILAGGAAKSIAPALSVPHKLVDNLVLVGLHAVAIDQPRSGNAC